MIIYCVCISMCVSSMNLVILCCITSIYTAGTLREWLLLLAKIDLNGQSIIVHIQYIHPLLFQTIAFLISLHPCYFSVQASSIISKLTDALQHSKAWSWYQYLLQSESRLDLLSFEFG